MARSRPRCQRSSPNIGAMVMRDVASADLDRRK
jgi:hypothetical protein